MDPYRRPLDWLKTKLKPVIESDVYLQSFGMFLLRNVPALLPHDLDYHALRHFLADRGERIFLDVGANIGLSALSFRKVDKTTPIYSLEPNPSHYKTLSRIERQDPHFKFRMVGAGDRPERLDLFVPFVGAMCMHTMAAVSLEDLKSHCERAFAPRYQSRVVIKRFTVDIVRIDDLGLDPAIIKVDAEGHEEPILRGAGATIDRCRPYVMLEKNPRHFEESRDTFKDSGYELVFYDQHRDVFTRTPLAARNVFLIPKEKLVHVPVA